MCSRGLNIFIKCRITSCNSSNIILPINNDCFKATYINDDNNLSQTIEKNEEVITRHTNDPVKSYLKVMSNIPLLSREDEVDIAIRIENGRSKVCRFETRRRKDHPGNFRSDV